MYKNLFQKIVYVLAVLLVSQTVMAQVAYHNFNSNSGLPSNETYCVMQDRAGYMWFGTDHGVVRYNGYNFKTYTTSDGLTDNTVFSIKEDDEGRLWFLTMAGGICYYDGKVFAPHPNNDTIVKLFGKRIPTAWEIIDNATIWLGFVDFGFYKITKNTANGYLSEPLYTAKDNKDGDYFFLLKLKGEKYVYTSCYGRNRMPTIGDKDVTMYKTFYVDTKDWLYTDINFSLKVQPNGNIMVGAKYMALILNNGKILSRYVCPQGTSIIRITGTSDSKIWLTNENGFSYSVESENGKLRFVDSLCFVKSATDIYLDRNGNYWLTALENGIYIVPNKSIRTLTDQNISSTTKISTCSADHSNLFAGLRRGELLKVDTTWKTKLVSTTIRDPGMISHIQIDSGGQPMTERDKIFEKLSTRRYYISKFIKLNARSILVGGTGGITVFQDEKEIFDSRKMGFAKRVTELCEISPARFAVGTLNGLYYFANGPRYTIVEEKELSGARITSCRKLNNQVFAVASRGNGVLLNVNKKTFFVTEKKGLVSNLTEDVYFENDSTLWVASFKGLSKITYHNIDDSLYTRIRCYTKEDGLCSDQINAITFFNGHLCLATNEGLSYFRPGDLTEDTSNIPIYLGNVYVNGTKQNAEGQIFEYYRNNFLIEFNALYYKAISGIRYKVRLKGIDAWKYTNQNFIQYFNLQPGNYDFEVAAEDMYGKYKSDIRSLHFTIQPRFIDTFLFKSLMFLLAFIVIGTGVYAVFNFQRVKSRNVIKLLQAEFKALNYQINPHFIFNVLNSIQYYILRKDTDNAVHMLSSFSTLIRKIVSNSKQQYISVIEEVECLKEYMDLEKIRLDNKFEYEINIDSSMDIEKKEILPMILQPLVENSIWHGIAPLEGSGKITIDFKLTDGQIVCTVEDNGVGINSTTAKREKNQSNLSLAMKNVSERLKIISELNNSTWAVNTTDKSNFAKGGRGTIVTVIFPTIKENK